MRSFYVVQAATDAHELEIIRMELDRQTDIHGHVSEISKWLNFPTVQLRLETRSFFMCGLPLAFVLHVETVKQNFAVHSLHE